MLKIKSPFRKLLLASATLFLIYLFTAGNYNIFDLWKLHKEKLDIKENIVMEERENIELKTQIELLKNDSVYIEKIAREQYRMGKKGETVYIVKEQAGK